MSISRATWPKVLPSSSRSALMLLAIAVGLCAAAAGYAQTPPRFVLLEGPVQRRGVPISSSDVSRYLAGDYVHLNGVVQVAYADRELVRELLDDQEGVWETARCDGRRFRRAARYGRDHWVPTGSEDLIISFAVGTEGQCEFLELLLLEIDELRSQPGFEQDPFPALLPMPR